MLNYQRVTDDSPGIPGGSDAICRSQAHVTELPTLELVGTICWRLLSFAKQLRDQVGERKNRLKILGNHGETHSSPTCSLQNGEFLGIHHGIQHFPNKVIRRSNFEAKKVTKFSIFEASLKR